MSDKHLKEVVFYCIERTNKRARQYSQQRLQQLGYDITIDQWLVLKSVMDNNGEAKQNEIAALVVKDNASITRIVDILEKRDWVQRQKHPNDRRTILLSVTETGKSLYQKLLPEIRAQRQKGLEGFSDKEINQVKDLLNRIYENLA